MRERGRESDLGTGDHVQRQRVVHHRLLGQDETAERDFGCNPGPQGRQRFSGPRPRFGNARNAGSRIEPTGWNGHDACHVRNDRLDSFVSRLEDLTSVSSNPS